MELLNEKKILKKEEILERIDFFLRIDNSIKQNGIYQDIKKFKEKLSTKDDYVKFIHQFLEKKEKERWESLKKVDKFMQYDKDGDALFACVKNKEAEKNVERKFGKDVAYHIKKYRKNIEIEFNVCYLVTDREK